MVKLDGKTEVNLLDSNGNEISLGETNSVLVSVDVPMNEEVKLMSSVKSFNISGTSMFDKRTIDYICGFLSPAEYKMPKKKHRKNVRIKKRFKKYRELF